MTVCVFAMFFKLFCKKDHISDIRDSNTKPSPQELIKLLFLKIMKDGTDLKYKSITKTLHHLQRTTLIYLITRAI